MINCVALMMVEDISEMMANLIFTKEESKRVFCITTEGLDLSGYGAWAVGKILSNEKKTKRRCIESYGPYGSLRRW